MSFFQHDVGFTRRPDAEINCLYYHTLVHFFELFRNGENNAKTKTLAIEEKTPVSKMQSVSQIKLLYTPFNEAHNETRILFV